MSEREREKEKEREKERDRQTDTHAIRYAVEKLLFVDIIFNDFTSFCFCFAQFNNAPKKLREG